MTVAVQAVSLLKDADTGASQGRPQYLSGLLRNLAKNLLLNPAVHDPAATWQALSGGTGGQHSAMPLSCLLCLQACRLQP